MADIEDTSLNGIFSKVIFPESTFARSSISLINTINELPLNFIAFRYSLCFADKSVFKTTLVNPMMAFMGVRISWLMFDKNCCFAFTASSAIFVAISALLFASSAMPVASSANTIASVSSFAINFCSVTSRATITTPNTLPVSSL